jgi:enoyl-CoA hydratase/carnithine racemase
MPSEFILTTADAGVFTITIGRPAKMNALTPEMHMALGEAFDAFAADDAAQVCVVTGAGDRAFCAGSDLAGFKASEHGTYPPGGYAGLARRHDLTKPVIAAVNGLCLGGGFELALACDMIVASPTAVFGLPEPKVGLIAIGGGIHRLVRQIGLKQAMGPLLTGRNIAAQEGFAMGFVSEIAEAGKLDEAVAGICAQIVANAPLAVRLTKELAMWGLDQPTLARALVDQGHQPSYRRWMASEDACEGPKAFVEKRPQEWTGR